MTELTKSIELFLQKNGMIDTLKAFKSECKRTPLSSGNKFPTQLVNIHKTIIPTDIDNQNKLREHLQKADIKYLKKFVERMRKTPKILGQDMGNSKISEQPFFKRLMQKQKQRYEQYKENMLISINTPQFLDQSRVCQNQWEGENDRGFDQYQFSAAQWPKIIREIQSLKNYQSTALKDVPYPQNYYSQWQQTKNTISYNIFDKLTTKLPPNIYFDQKNKTGNDLYPLESQGIAFGCHQLKVIFDRQKTGYQDERQMPIVINQVLAGRFQIVSVLGQAQFSKAIEVKDLTSSNQKQRLCLKMILNNKDYLDQALDQIKLLRYIKANCNPDQTCLINMHDYFYHREHMMILTQLLKENLLDAYRNKPEYFTLQRIQLISRQVLIALTTLHRLHIIHSDLKPQNILIKSYSNTQIKVIDVGSSVFFHDQLQSYVQTRSYRAPEVILGLDYTDKIDIWSLGCIIAEIYTGQVLFDSQNQVGLLARMQGIRGPWPSWMIQRGKEVPKYFKKQMILFQEICEEGAEGEENKKKRRKTGLYRVFLPKMTNLKSRVRSNSKHFLDFLSKCLKLDPSVRMSAKQALIHPFITETLQQQ